MNPRSQEAKTCLVKSSFSPESLETLLCLALKTRHLMSVTVQRHPLLLVNALSNAAFTDMTDVDANMMEKD